MPVKVASIIKLHYALLYFIDQHTFIRDWMLFLANMLCFVSTITAVVKYVWLVVVDQSVELDLVKHESLCFSKLNVCMIDNRTVEERSQPSERQIKSVYSRSQNIDSKLKNDKTSSCSLLYVCSKCKRHFVCYNALTEHLCVEHKWTSAEINRLDIKQHRLHDCRVLLCNVLECKTCSRSLTFNC